MAPNLRISRKSLFVLLFGVAVAVVAATLYSRKLFRSQQDGPAQRFFRQQVLRFVDRALSQAAPTKEEAEFLESIAAPTATVFEHRMAVSLYQKMGRLDEAIARYRNLLQRNPKEPALMTGLAGCLLYAGRPMDARPLFEQALALDPSSWQARVKLSAALAAENRSREALALCLRLVRSGGEANELAYADGYGNAAVFAANLGQMAEALSYAERAVRFRRRCAGTLTSDSELSQDLLVRGNIYLNLGSLDEALRDLGEALELARSSRARGLEIHIQYARAICYLDLGQRSSGLRLQRQVGELIQEYTDEQHLRRLLLRPTVGGATVPPP